MVNNDSIVENNEDLRLVLSTNEMRVDLGPDTSDVTIIDDDSELVIIL